MAPDSSVFEAARWAEKSEESPLAQELIRYDTAEKELRSAIEYIVSPFFVSGCQPVGALFDTITVIDGSSIGVDQEKGSVKLESTTGLVSCMPIVLVREKLCVVAPIKMDNDLIELDAVTRTGIWKTTSGLVLPIGNTPVNTIHYNRLSSLGEFDRWQNQIESRYYDRPENVAFEYYKEGGFLGKVGEIDPNEDNRIEAVVKARKRLQFILDACFYTYKDRIMEARVGSSRSELNHNY